LGRAYMSSGRSIWTMRPESFSFANNDEGSSQKTQGQVEDVVFIGSRSFYTVRLDDQAKVRIQVQRNGRVKPPEPGSRATIYWDADNVVMLPQA
jgi:spermidine/putrescine transport system ATP-binding protein